MKRTAMAALVFAVSLAWGTAMGAVPAEKTGKALAGAAAVTAEKAGTGQTAPKAAKAAAYGTSDKDGKDSKKETAHVPTDDDCVLLDSLNTLSIPPLQASDFYIGSIHHGDSPAKVKRIFGPPTKFSRSTHYTTMQYNDKDLKMRFVFRNKTADSLRYSAGNRKAVIPGAESMFLSSGTMLTSITLPMKARGKMSCTSLPSATAASNEWPSCRYGRRTLREKKRRTA